MMPRKNDYQISEDSISIEDYQRLRKLSGLSLKSTEAAEIGLSNSLYCVSLLVEGKIIGMGRLIGDGGCFCQVVDICVLPEHQGKGLGKMIMSRIVDYIHTKLPKSCYVSLIADGEAYRLYEQFGFKATMPVSRGMYVLVQ